MSSAGRAGGAASPGDYAAVSLEIFFEPGDFVPDGLEWVARKEVALSILRDGEAEPDETFDLKPAPPGRRQHLPGRHLPGCRDGRRQPGRGGGRDRDYARATGGERRHER